MLYYLVFSSNITVTLQQTLMYKWKANMLYYLVFCSNITVTLQQTLMYK